MGRALLIGLALLLGGCAAPRDVEPSPRATERAVAQATTAPPLSVACRSAGEIQALLEVFARAMNAGDRDAIASAVSSSAQWFSLTQPSGHEVAYGHDEMVSHLLAMSAAGDRFVTTPTTDQVTLEGWDGAGHFGLAPFTFERNGKLLRLSGKGAVYCGGRARGFEVMSLGLATSQ